MLENSGSLNIFVILSIGLVYGLKHATEVDHVVAITTIVSRHKNVFRSSVVGALWGMGHTASLLVVAVIVLSLRITIPEHVSAWWDPSGAPLSECTIDLRPGGAFRFVNRGNAHSPPFEGAYLVIERPGKLVFDALGIGR